jgi:hypothetical protein
MPIIRAILVASMLNLVALAVVQASPGGGSAMTLTPSAWSDGVRIPVKCAPAVPNPVLAHRSGATSRLGP